MSKILRVLGWTTVLAGPALPAVAQAPAERVVVVSSAVGETIDGGEKARFGLFPYYSANDFLEARFVRAQTPDSALTLRTRLRDGRELARPFTPAEFQAVRESIDRRIQELGAQGVPIAAAPGSPVAAPVPASGGSEIVGRTYSIELRSGTIFNGVLRAATATDLEFDTRDLGVVRVQRTNLKVMALLTVAQAAKGYTDVGNGTRMFFAPTARNLRRGQGYVEDIDVVLLAANYGITDNFSVGVLLPVIPVLVGRVFAFTPKVSVAVSEKFHVGVGALYARASLGNSSVGGGVAYGVGTYGTADDNVTLGLGYGFTDQGETARTPVVVLGGAKRVSNRFSVLNETYLANTGILGLVGGRYHTERFSGCLGFAYGTALDGFFFPAYFEAAYRFGKFK